MIRTFRKLLCDRRGSPSVDFALTMPALILMTVGVMQLGIAFLANAGLRNAVEVGARYATVYPYPTNDAIISKVRSHTFGIDPAQLSTPVVTRNSSNGENYVEVSATYPVRFNLIFFTTPSFNLTYTRRAYQL
jgi:Flp pilus assembly protein TadG